MNVVSTNSTGNAICFAKTTPSLVKDRNKINQTENDREMRGCDLFQCLFVYGVGKLLS